MRPQSIVLPLALLGAVLALAAWAILARGHLRDGRPSSGADSTDAALREHVRRLDERLSRMETLLGALPAVNAPAASANSAPAETAHLPTEDEARQQAARIQSGLEGVFATDARANDAGKWEARIGQAFDDPEVAAVAQPSTRSAQCRTRECRITAQFPPGAEGSEWANRVAMSLADGFSSSRVVWDELPTGESAVTLYIFKKGTENILTEQGL